jgi:protein AFG1
VIDSRELSVWGRKLHIPQSTSTVARFPFEKLCGEPLSSADYLEITGNFEVIFVEDMPELGIDRKDAVSTLREAGKRQKGRRAEYWYA